MKINFLTGSNDVDILEANLLRSDAVQRGANCHIFPNPVNIPAVYNLLKFPGSLICYIHHDVYLPPLWLADLEKALTELPDDWGVLGVAGVRSLSYPPYKLPIGWISDRGKPWGTNFYAPREVDTLDELLLITRGDLEFDEQFPFDFYGADICLQAREQGRKSYAIHAYCEHNSTRKVGQRTPAFYEAEARFRKKWEKYLPIATTCSLLFK